MYTKLLLVYLLAGTLTFIPIIRMDLFKTNSKYKYFKYVSLAMFFWTILSIFKYGSFSSFITYYSTLTVYPLVYLITSLILIAIMRYLGKKISVFTILIIVIFFVFDMVVSYTNNFHQYMLQLSYNSELTTEVLISSDYGSFFYVHAIFCYVTLFFAMTEILIELYKNFKKYRDVYPFLFMIIGIVIGISSSVIHIFFFDLGVDPTYIALVLVMMILYSIFYIRDVQIVLKLNGNELILNNLREMYILVDQDDVIVSASNEFLNRFSLRIDKKITFLEFEEKISKDVTIYLDSKNLDGSFDENKMYLHLMKKNIYLPLLKKSAKFYLFYDETENLKNINEINYVMTHDLMTGIYNRNYFETLELEIEENYNNYSLIMFDIDGLKHFNDYLGHEAGDKLLIRFSNALKTIVKKYDNLIPIRMGGDEFLLIAIDKDMNDIEEIIYHLKLLTSKKDLLENVGFSYGYSQKNDSNTSFKKVMFVADSKQRQMKTTRKKAKDELENFLKSLENEM